MNDSVFEQIHASAKVLGIDLCTSELAAFADQQEFSSEDLDSVCKVFDYLRQKKEEAVINTLLRMSRLPLKEPKTFDSFDFDHVHGKDVNKLKNLSSLSPIYAHKNLAFIGPQGVGKTHLAMAFGRECCCNGMKTYFLKATELNQKLSDAVKYGREGSCINGLVKPSCLIIDEIGRCVFNQTNTRLFFDIVDRRYNKDGPNTIIFTSNKSPDKWGEYFREDDSLLCSLDRVFDDATVFIMKGDSYRGRKLETVALHTGRSKPITNK